VTRILVVDNYDSFVYTLNGYLNELGAETHVIRNDAILVADVDNVIADYDGVLVSPGPGKPSDAGVSIAIVQAAERANKPLLGVCLGHQAIPLRIGMDTIRNSFRMP
jgi:para-aminobenzoate synthetase component 2